MIELTQEQLRAVEGEQVPILVNPQTREEFVLIRKERYDSV